MNFDDAIKAHTFWKVTLRWMINGQRLVDGKKLARDDECELGRWIVGAGIEYTECSAFQALVKEHAAFHLIAGDVAKKIADGNSEDALQMMSDSGDFSQASAKTIEAIRLLQREVEQRSGQQ